MNSLLSSANLGIVGLLTNKLKKEQFSGRYNDYPNYPNYSDYGFPTVVIIVFILILLPIIILLLVCVYKMVPNYKGLHTLFVSLLGLLYFVPMLTYYVIGNGYKLRKLSK